MKPETRPPVSSVILVREWEQQMSSSGCCGRLQGDFLSWGGGEPVFTERRRAMEGAGALYRALRSRYGDEVEIRVVDPRNLVSLLPLLFRDFRRHRVPLRDLLRTLFGFRVNAVVADGRLVSSASWSDPEAVLDELEHRRGAGRELRAGASGRTGDHAPERTLTHPPTRTGEGP